VENPYCQVFTGEIYSRSPCTVALRGGPYLHGVAIDDRPATGSGYYAKLAREVCGIELQEDSTEYKSSAAYARAQDAASGERATFGQVARLKEAAFDPRI
jgi:hypothetical protein